MFDCLILGDSIAYGTGNYLKECKTYAEIGISPKNYDKKFLEKELISNSVIFSLGSNNPGNNLKDNLTKIRKKVKTSKIIWILPNDEKLKKIIKELAISKGDDFVEFEVSKDKIHPKNYKSLAEKIKDKLN